MFALVHGGQHGGWCWDLLVSELHARGHEAVAPDLPTEDPNAGALEYARIVVDALAHYDGEPVVVGHSMGGLTIPVVASLRLVQRLVFLGAYVPRPGMSFTEYAAAAGHVSNAKPWDFDDDGLRAPLTWEQARVNFYHDVSEPLAREAVGRLRRQSWRAIDEQCPLERWPDVPSTAIVMTEDAAVRPDWARRLARENIGIETVELPGSHSPFLSRPAALADLLSSL
jgi:pimeloyl-ACP methyl ester carboxylesterase